MNDSSHIIKIEKTIHTLYEFICEKYTIIVYL